MKVDKYHHINVTYTTPSLNAGCHPPPTTHRYKEGCPPKANTNGSPGRDSGAGPSTGDLHALATGDGAGYRQKGSPSPSRILGTGPTTRLQETPQTFPTWDDNPHFSQLTNPFPWASFDARPPPPPLTCRPQNIPSHTFFC